MIPEVLDILRNHSKEHLCFKGIPKAHATHVLGCQDCKYSGGFDSKICSWKWSDKWAVEDERVIFT